MWKVRIFSLAAGMALMGIALDERWMTGTALALLLGGVLFRFLPRDEVDTDVEESAEEEAG